MKKTHESSNENKPDVDKAKRVYRAAVDAIKRLDEVLKQRKAYREVFTQDAVGLRNKLKEYSERLMFYNPIEYGRKAEDVLWRKVFYQIIQLIKQNRKHVRPGSTLESAFRTHLVSATGYYNHLLFRLQYEFCLNLHGVLDFHLVPEQKTGHRKSFGHNSRRKDVNPKVQDWATKACHRCLVCLGDIARYQQDFDKGFSKSASERFYHQAIALCPDNGMPHNQLGTLSGSRYVHCEAAYHYIRCMVCEKPFEGAEGNLQRLFEKNRKRFLELKQSANHNIPMEPQSFQDLKYFLTQFLHLLSIFYDTSKNPDSSELQESCQATLQSFNLCMFHEPDIYGRDDYRLDGLQHLDDDMVFKLVVMCMATIHLLQLRGSRQVTAATAFLLALFSHILNHVVIRLHAALDEKENPNKLLQRDLHQDVDEEMDDFSDPEENGRISHHALRQEANEIRTPSQNHNNSNSQYRSVVTENSIQHEKSEKPKSSRIKSFKRRRRKRHNSDDSSDLSDVSDLSEGADNLSDNFLSGDSEEEEEEFVGFFTNDSDSDMSDGLMESQELEPGFAETSKSSTNSHDEHAAFPSTLPENADSAIWINQAENEKLAHLSSELYSSSVSFLRQNLKLSPQNNRSYECDVAEFEKCKDVIQGKKEVPVPPGFASSKEAHHVAEITNKLANFVIETDTEASVAPTDSEQSGADVENDTETEDYSSTSGSGDRVEINHRQLKYTIDVVHNEGLLSTVKLMCDWMRCNSGVIMTCAQSSQSLWHRLSVLCNILPVETILADHDQCWMDEVKTVLCSVRNHDWHQIFPLREDINLSQFPPLADAHSSLKLNIKRKGHISEMQECFLRVGCIRQFGHFLSSLESLHFHYDEEQKTFVGPTQPVDTNENEQEAMKRVADEESRRNQLMRDMAQLRLQAEVSQLEGSLDTHDQSSFPPYLIPDPQCLCDSLTMVKQLLQSGKGILVIPTSVIDCLDVLKKESGRAREAIRWLEAEFRKGNRYIRAQKSNEKLQDSTPKLLKKDKTMWCLFEILNCACYLALQGGDLNGGNMVAVLTAKETDRNNLPPVVKKMLTTQEGVNMSSISSFLSKWKDVPKSKG